MNKRKNENFLEKIPIKNKKINWYKDEKNLVTLEKKNCGIVNKLAQMILKKPKTSYIHLDELGSFVWLSVDGQENLIEIAKKVKECFGEKADPLYERLTEYIQILYNCGFIIIE